jgi:PhnB protein
MTVSVSPQLSVRRGREALAFYSAAFGTQVTYQVGGTDDLPEVVAELSVGQSTFWVSDEAPAHGASSPETLGGSSVKLLLRVDDPAAVQARAVSLGASEIRPVAPSHGWLIGRIADPFGHHWEIAKPLGPWPPGANGGVAGSRR